MAEDGFKRTVRNNVPRERFHITVLDVVIDPPLKDVPLLDAYDFESTGLHEPPRSRHRIPPNEWTVRLRFRLMPHQALVAPFGVEHDPKFAVRLQ